MADNLGTKIPKEFYCEFCNYRCSNKKDYNKHLATRKHQNTSKILPKIPKNPQKSLDYFECECGNTYKHRQSLYKHQQNCLINENKIEQMNYSVNNICKDTQQTDFKDLVLLLLKENKEIQKNFIDIIPHLKGNNNSHNTITNNTTNNNQFNINMFLNEHCKNAMNITDFIESLPLTAEAYNNTIENGLTKNMTTMITDGLNNMDIHKRPIHCTDPARKTIYIKDNDVWEKDTELKLLLENITHLACKHRGNIHKWQDVNEGWEEIEDLQTKLTNIVYHTMEDVENDEKEMNKIYRAISKNTYLSNDIKDQYK